MATYKVEARTLRKTDTTFVTVHVEASDDFEAAQKATRVLCDTYGNDAWAIDSVDCLTTKAAKKVGKQIFIGF